MDPHHWLPLTEYALRSGMSISTLRRKIKSHAIEYKMEEGRYLIRSDELDNLANGYHSSDLDEGEDEYDDGLTAGAASQGRGLPGAGRGGFDVPAEILQLRQEMQQIRTDAQGMQEQDSVRWRALEARVTGMAKKLELFAEQFAELKMLVKLFEEKLDRRA